MKQMLPNNLKSLPDPINVAIIEDQRTIREVIHGGAPMSPEVARRVIELFQQFRPPEAVNYHLTPHEIRLLRLLVEGHNYKTAAKEVDCTIHAISFHMKKYL